MFVCMYTHIHTCLFVYLFVVCAEFRGQFAGKGLCFHYVGSGIELRLSGKVASDFGNYGLG